MERENILKDLVNSPLWQEFLHELNGEKQRLAFEKYDDTLGSEIIARQVLARQMAIDLVNGVIRKIELGNQKAVKKRNNLR